MSASSFIMLLVRSRWRLLVYDYDHDNADDENHEDDSTGDHGIQCSTRVSNLAVQSTELEKPKPNRFGPIGIFVTSRTAPQPMQILGVQDPQINCFTFPACRCL